MNAHKVIRHTLITDTELQSQSSSSVKMCVFCKLNDSINVLRGEQTGENVEEKENKVHSMSGYLSELSNTVSAQNADKSTSYWLSDGSLFF